MTTWPQIHLPVTDYLFPDLELTDSIKGIVRIPASGSFSMYVCGITPYDATHLGHAATYLAFDLINRYQLLANNAVSFIENVTDIDDPLLVRASRDNLKWQDLAKEQIELFKADMTALRVIPPVNLVSVTDSMDLIEQFINRLSENGYLYKLEDDYYFAVEEFLSDLPMCVEEAGKIFKERGGDPDRQGKKHLLDPIVWIGNQGQDPGWPSQFGFGRPGWHVECTAIACHYLDQSKSDPIIDLQGGGSDLKFPHHFMSAKIVKAAFGRDFAQFYIHTGMVGLDGEKMSKSKGNLVFVSELLNDQVDPMVLRWALLSDHYQSDRQWSDDLLRQAQSQVDLVRSALSRSEVPQTTELIAGIISDISRNLDTPVALNRIVQWARKCDSDACVNESGRLSRVIDSILGLSL